MSTDPTPESRIRAEIATSNRLRTAWREDCGRLAAVLAQAKELGEYDGATNPLRYDSQKLTHLLHSVDAIADAALREVRAKELEDTAAEFRRAAAAGLEPATNRTAARILDNRATAIREGRA